MDNNVRVNRVESVGSTGKYECGFCHQKFNDPTQYMKHEQMCYNKRQAEAEKRKVEEQRVKEKQRKTLAQKDTERLQNQYHEFIKNIEHHETTYGEPVKIDGHYYGRDLDDMPFKSDIFDSLFNSIFMI